MKLKKLNKALVAAGLVAGAAVSMPSQAVVMSDDGTGEVLIYPFYTVQGPAGAPRASLFTITNTKDEYKAVKVRFHEAHNSRDALDFNLYLSPFDVWTGVVSRSGDVAVLTTTDKSCTIPSSIMTNVNAFSTLAYTQTSNNDGGNQSGLRTNEGYLEVIEMGVVNQAAQINASLTTAAGATPFNATTGAIDSFGEAIKHTNGMPGGSMGSSGVPVGCEALQASFAAGGVWDIAAFDNTHAEVSQPTGGLMGSALIVQAATGTVAGYDATALKHFYDVGADNVFDASADGIAGNANAFNDIHSFKDLNPVTANARSIQTSPNLAMAFPQASKHYDADALTDTDHLWAAAVPLASAGVTASKVNVLDAAITDLADDANNGAANRANARPVSAVLAKESLINEYVLDQDAASGIDFRTDVVVTFPTKWYFTDNGLYLPGATAGERVTTTDPATDSDVEAVDLAPFTSQFVTEAGQGTACESFSIASADGGALFDREEGTPSAAVAGGLVPSPAINTEAPAGNSFCHEANVLTLNDGDILTSRIANGLDATVANSADAANSFNIDLPAGFTSGWFEMKFTDAGHTMNDTAGNPVPGLPAVGFVVEGLVAGSTAFDGNFTAALPHKSR